METTEIKLRIIKSRKEDFVEDEPIWVGRYYYPKCKVGATEIYLYKQVGNVHCGEEKSSARMVGGIYGTEE